MPRPPRAKKKGTRLLAASYSRLQTYERCPQQARYKYIDKLPEGESGPAAKRGMEIHDKSEKYIGGELKRVPADLYTFGDEFRALRKDQKKKGFTVEAEVELAFDGQWNRCGWFDRQVSEKGFRAKLDILRIHGTTANVFDVKTGKIREEHIEQLESYAVAVFEAYEHIETVEAAMWYVDQGKETVRSYARADLKELKKDLTKRLRKYFADTRFVPNPTNACRWCAFSKAKGGPCKF